MTNYYGMWPSPCPRFNKKDAAKVARKLWRFSNPKMRKQKMAAKFKLFLKFETLVCEHDGLRYTINLRCDWPEFVWMFASGAVKGTPYATRDLAHRLAQHVIDQRWMYGALRPIRPEKPKPDKRQVRLARIVRRIKSWQTKQKRAENALRELYRQKKYYERVVEKDRKKRDPVEFILDARDNV